MGQFQCEICGHVWDDSGGYDCPAHKIAEAKLPSAMVWREAWGCFILPSGRTIDPNGEIIGLSMDGKVHEGWDCGIETDDWLVEDIVALADYMIAAWTKWRLDNSAELEERE